MRRTIKPEGVGRMGKDEGERRLAAILSADVAGYSRLMGDDERATVRTLTGYRKVFSDHIERHKGRVVDTAGDSVLAVFGSVVEAVQCAVNIQSELATRNNALTEDRRMHFRVGINLGDVIEQDDGTIYGDGVNIAARLESLAQPGGITVSGTVFDHAENKLSVVFEFTGEQAVKNIAKPVRAYRVVAETASAALPSADKPLTLPDKPSIAVLPFDNLSGDPEQEYFADGIVEDLITALSRARWMFVIARNSTFAYKGQSPDVRQVGRDLGVRYMVEGSVRKRSERVRISAQLIDATTGVHLWADRYDRQLDDLFNLQDEISGTIVAAIEAEVGAVERERARRIPPENLDAWESYQKGWWHLYQHTAADIQEAREHFKLAAKLDPSFAPSYAAISYVDFLEVIDGLSVSPADSVRSALEIARKAVALDDKEPMAHFAFGRALQLSNELDAAIAELSLTIELDPNLATAYLGLSLCLTLAGRPQEGVIAANMAQRLSPRDPFLWGILNARVLAWLMLGDFEQAVQDGLKAIRHPNANFWTYVNLAAAQGHLGRTDDARATFKNARHLKPDFSMETLRRTHSPLGRNKGLEFFRTVHAGLRKAGLDIPDEPAAGD